MRRLRSFLAGHAGRARHALLLSWRPSGRLAVALGVLGCLGLVMVGQGPIDASATRHARAEARMAALSTVERPGTASRSAQRATSTLAGAPSTQAKPAAKKPPSVPKAVAGLSRAQTNNAYQIVQAGKALGMPKQAYVVAIATALQESTLRNLASDVVPESLRYPHQGRGSDHDSVGLFQQRPSSGWGAVKNLMKPRYAATKFYQALRRVPGWQRMAVTYAAQAVQVSAFPQAYAQHEGLARRVVAALT